MTFSASRFPASRLSANWLVRVALSIAAVALLLGVQMLLQKYISDYYVQIILTAGINIILAVSLNLINGVTGQFSLGHAGFMAVGAYGAAAFTYYRSAPLLANGAISSQIGVFLIALLLAATSAAIAGFLVGLPSLRLRGDYLTIVTLGFNQIIIVLITNNAALQGASGFKNLPQLTNFAWVYGMAGLCVLSLRNLGRSVLGRSMRAVRDDEIAAQAVGINTTKIKTTAFVVSALWAGIAGALQAHLLQSTDPTSFSFQKSVEIVVMVVLGGLGSITGSVLTAIILTALSEVLRSLAGAFAVGLGLVVLAAILSFPKYREPMKKGAHGWFLWMRWPVLSASIMGILFFHNLFEKLLQQIGLAPVASYLARTMTFLLLNQAALRYVIYALILIVLMLLRPQGLLGRGEFGWHLFRRAQDEDSSGELESSTR